MTRNVQFFNYLYSRSIAISKENPADERIYAGFLNLIELDNLLKIALTTTGNDGITISS